MALAKEMMGCSLNNLSTSKMFGSDMSLVARPVLVMPLQKKRRMQGRRMAIKGPVAAISEDIIRTNRHSRSTSDTSNFVVGQDQRGRGVLKATAVLTVKNKSKEDFQETLLKHLDAFADRIGWNVVLELISTQIDPKTKEPKRSRGAVLKDWSKKSNVKAERIHCTAEFTIGSDFGEVGAIAVRNKHQKDFFLETITLEIEGFPNGPVHFPCNSWVQSTKDLPEKRIFFSNKPYLPSETPAGLRALRENELKELRGDGQGVRKLSDRVYDYDVYNDLGNPDKSLDLTRPILGGKAIPYPRRCRTGRLPSHTDINVESRVEKPLPVYVPKDEQFEEIKRKTFLSGRFKAVLHNLIPALRTRISAENEDFNTFSDIDLLYKEGLVVKVGLKDEIWKKLPLPRVVTKIEESSESLLKYDIPKIVEKDRFSWLRDDEFARQFLAGVNPATIERVTVFPPKSSLDPEVHGPVESALKEEHILGYLNGMSVQQAIDENKLFMVDYHDVYLPFVDKINALDGRKTYATRTLFFLTAMGTLRPIAIELSLPPAGPSSRSKRVVTPPLDATTNWVWLLAKAHVMSNDGGAHQLVHHWLRTHAAVEPFIIAANRHLSAMHPIFKLLDPHTRYTMEINALARQNLINADGVIENCFTPGRYNMEISAAAYKNLWRFDKESLPEDLIRRGMAVRDPTQPLGVKLVLEDYPYAQDGILIWQEIENWVSSYVNHYYPDSSIICSDKELQSWYSEAVNVGHADLRDADWWPTLVDADDLVSILTTIIWLASAQHAALNFGQYPYGGYVPNRPTLMRRLIPEENDPEYTNFQADPQKFFLSSLPSLLQATKLMAVIDTLSTHSADEEYLGERKHPSTWTGDAEMIQAFYNFSAGVRQVEKEIDRRNADPTLRNRCGAGVLPYELLAPSSGPGVTCRGIPNSVTI